MLQLRVQDAGGSGNSGLDAELIITVVDVNDEVPTLTVSDIWVCTETRSMKIVPHVPNNDPQPTYCLHENSNSSDLPVAQCPEGGGSGDFPLLGLTLTAEDKDASAKLTVDIDWDATVAT